MGDVEVLEGKGFPSGRTPHDTSQPNTAETTNASEQRCVIFRGLFRFAGVCFLCFFFGGSETIFCVP